MLFLAEPFLWADVSDIHVVLIFTDKKGYYQYDEKLPVRAFVRNDSQTDILITEGFTSQYLISKIRLIDPAGRLLISERAEEPKKILVLRIPPLSICAVPRQTRPCCTMRGLR